MLVSWRLSELAKVVPAVERCEVVRAATEGESQIFPVQPQSYPTHHRIPREIPLPIELPVHRPLFAVPVSAPAPGIRAELEVILV